MTKTLSSAEINSICQSVKSEQLEHFEHFALFVGHAHSGHSIIGALLDAHPNIGIANEINVPKILLDHKSITKEEVLKLSLYYSLAANKEWLNTEYKYRIKESYQGHTTKPIILGDKKGGGGTRIIMNHPYILDKLLLMFGDNLKIIHVNRDPIDNIFSYAYYWNETIGPQHLARYLENLETTYQIKNKIKHENWLTLIHKDFISNPINVLANLYDFLNAKYNENQLRSYCSIVKPNIKSKRMLFNQNDLFLQEIKTKIDKLNAKYLF